MQKPKKLKQGDTIGLIAPASPPKTDIIDLAVKRFNEFGFNVEVGQSCYDKYGYLAGSDELRAADLNIMFQSPNIDGIICIRGGYGTPRILDMLDYANIAKNPKVFVGYSDITAIHTALNQKCDLVTFHGPMASDMARKFDDFSKESFMNSVILGGIIGELLNPPGEVIECLVGGKGSGIITGGNLSLIAATIGTPYEIDTKDKLLLIEEIDEPPYRVDRMLTQLRLSGKLEECSGIILGDWNNCEDSDSEKSLSLMQVFDDIIKPLGKPTIYNFKAGHCKSKVTIPLGVSALLDADNCRLIIKESAVI